MYLGKKKLLIILNLIDEYLEKYSWKDLEKLREEIVGKLV